MSNLQVVQKTVYRQLGIQSIAARSSLRSIVTYIRVIRNIIYVSLLLHKMKNHDIQISICQIFILEDEVTTSTAPSTGK